MTAVIRASPSGGSTARGAVPTVGLSHDVRRERGRQRNDLAGLPLSLGGGEGFSRFGPVAMHQSGGDALVVGAERRALERAKGIEPSYEAWEAAVLPLNYARGRRGFYSLLRWL